MVQALDMFLLVAKPRHTQIPKTFSSGDLLWTTTDPSGALLLVLLVLRRCPTSIAPKGSDQDAFSVQPAGGPAKPTAGPRGVDVRACRCTASDVFRRQVMASAQAPQKKSEQARSPVPWLFWCRSGGADTDGLREGWGVISTGSSGRGMV